MCGGVATPDELNGLQNLAGMTIDGQTIQGNGASTHLAILAQDEQSVPEAKALNDVLGKLMNEVKAFAQRLAEQGHDVVGFSMQLYDQRDGSDAWGSCCSIGDLHDARRVAAEAGATLIIRGLRAGSDFEAELRMAHANRLLAPEIETVFLMTAPEHASTSSRLVREIARYGGPLDRLVPAAVIPVLAAAASRQRS